MQTVITDVSYAKTISLLKTEYENLSMDGCFFAIIRTEYDTKGNAVHDFLDVISVATEVGYEYVNTIVYPSSVFQKCTFRDNVKYVVWLSKKHSEMKFNKDAIREKHIWKDVEWGKRAKNYNPKGKDPGNVWIPTEDDGNAKITKHIMLDDDGVISRLLAMSDCGSDYKLVREEFKPVNMTQEETESTAVFQQGDVSVNATDIVVDNATAISGTCIYKTHSKVFFKSSEYMDEVRDKSVKLVVTSPPYWNLKDYFKKGQIGQESYETYLDRIKTVWTQCYSKLSDDGSLWININIRVKGGKVITIPKDFVKMCKEIGFFYKGVIIWHKSSGIPTSDKNIVDRHEYVLLFSKSENFSVNQAVFAEYDDYKNININGGAFWNINRKAGSVGKKYIHPAIYPNELVARIVNVSTDVGDLILDPFLGSGTSIIAAEQNHRSCIGYEYNEGFEELIKLRFDAEISDKDVEFINAPA